MPAFLRIALTLAIGSTIGFGCDNDRPVAAPGNSLEANALLSDVSKSEWQSFCEDLRGQWSQVNEDNRIISGLCYQDARLDLMNAAMSVHLD